jgi:Tol biopolymer transport system component
MKPNSILFAAMMMLAATAAGAESPYDLFQKALLKERTEGNFPEAIKLYQHIVDKFSTNHKIAAQALLQLAECQERLGSAQARLTLERLLREYGDQQETADAARSRLAVSSGQNAVTAASSKLVFSESAGKRIAAVSRDRRHIIQATADGGFGVRELATGKFRRLTNSGFDMAFSPDGSLIAFSRNVGPVAREVRVIGVDGVGERMLLHWDNGFLPWPMGFTPDGRRIIVHCFQIGKPTGTPGKVLSLSVADGSYETVWEGATYNEDLALSPDAKYIAYMRVVQREPETHELWLLSLENKTDVPILKHPATASPEDWLPDGSGILFLSDRRNRGKVRDLWLQRIADGRPQGTPSLIKTDMGDGSTLLTARDGTMYWTKTVATSEVLSAEVVPSNGKAGNIASLGVSSAGVPHVSPDGRSLAFVTVPARRQFSLGFLSLENGQSRSFSPKLQALGAPGFAWLPNGQSVIVSAREGNNWGLFRLNPEDGSWAKLKAGGYGYRFELSPDGKTVYHSRYKPADGLTHILASNIETGGEREVFEARGFGDYTLEIALSPDGARLAITKPDGADSVISIVSLTGGEQHEIHRKGQYRATVWSRDGRYLITRDTPADGRAELIRIPVDGGPAQSLGITAPEIGAIAVHPDGRRIYYVVKDGRNELWSMEHFLPDLKSSR